MAADKYLMAVKWKIPSVFPLFVQEWRKRALTHLRIHSRVTVFIPIWWFYWLAIRLKLDLKPPACCEAAAAAITKCRITVSFRVTDNHFPCKRPRHFALFHDKPEIHPAFVALFTVSSLPAICFGVSSLSKKLPHTKKLIIIKTVIMVKTHAVMCTH